VPIAVSDEWVERIRASMPELPKARFDRFRGQYGLSAYDAGVLTSSRAMADYFEKVVSAGAPAKQAGNWIMGDLQALLTEAKCASVESCKITPADLASMIALIENATISGKIAKDLLVDMFKSGKPPKTLVEEKGWVQISDRGALETLAREVIAANPEPVAAYKAGKKQTFGFLVGQMMKATKGKGNPKLINEILADELARGDVKGS
jgi:aspartyl-tRNA(Asn)/glutamyl-tRNA(Gln) amidotransferase subunit B